MQKSQELANNNVHSSTIYELIETASREPEVVIVDQRQGDETDFTGSIENLERLAAKYTCVAEALEMDRTKTLEAFQDLEKRHTLCIHGDNALTVLDITKVEIPSAVDEIAECIQSGGNIDRNMVYGLSAIFSSTVVGLPVGVFSGSFLAALISVAASFGLVWAVRAIFYRNYVSKKTVEQVGIFLEEDYDVAPDLAASNFSDTAELITTEPHNFIIRDGESYFKVTFNIDGEFFYEEVPNTYKKANVKTKRVKYLDDNPKTNRERGI